MADVLRGSRQAFVAVITEGSHPPWVFAGIYASTNHACTDEGFVSMLGRLVNIGLPICFIGDFNVLADSSKNVEGLSMTLRRLENSVSCYWIIGCSI